MFSKLLNNQFSTFVILLLIIGGMMAVFHFSRAGSDTGDENAEGAPLSVPEKMSNDPDYLALYGDIVDYLKWNRSTFNRIKQSIREYADATPDPLINTAEKNGLINFLESRHLSLLHDSIEQFCRVGRDINVLNDLGNDVNLFDNATHGDRVKGMKELAQTYRNALGLCSQISRYAAYEKCYQSKSDNLLSAIKEYQFKEFIRDNPYIMDLIKQCIFTLSEHSTQEVKVSECASSLCNCEKQFGKYAYYKRICDSLQNPVIEAPAAAPDTLKQHKL